MTTLLGLALAPVRLAYPDAAASGAQPWLLAAGVGTLVFVAGAVGVAIGVRAWRRLPPEERAFRKLAGALGLDRRQRATLRQLAEDHGVAPVAILLCPRGVVGDAAPDPGADRLA